MLIIKSNILLRINSIDQFHRTPVTLIRTAISVRAGLYEGSLGERGENLAWLVRIGGENLAWLVSL